MRFTMSCKGCGSDFTAQPFGPRCGICPGDFAFEYRNATPNLPDRPRGLWDYADLLPVREPQNAVTLGEGGTPLLLARQDHGCRLHWKLESQNPTGSQKDRALSVAMTVARESGFRRTFIVSTGSAGLACAAYAARAGLACLVIVPQYTPPERLLPIQALGAEILEVKGTFREIGALAIRLERSGLYNATTERAVNPFQAEAPKTIAYEIAAQLGRAPDWVVVPVGGGATLAGIGQGFHDLVRFGRADRMPRLVSVQPRAFNTLETAWTSGIATQDELNAIGCDEAVATVAINLKCGVPADGAAVLEALRQSDGIAVSVTDADALGGQAALGRGEGIFCEPSSAILSAAIKRLVVTESVIRADDVVVGVITGSGLREASTVGPLRVVSVLPDEDFARN